MMRGLLKMLSRFLVITLSLSSMAAFASVRAVVVGPDVTARAPLSGRRVTTVMLPMAVSPGTMNRFKV